MKKILFGLLILLLLPHLIYAEPYKEMNTLDNPLSTEERIDEINKISSEKDLNWIAGETTMSEQSLQEKKALLSQTKPQKHKNIKLLQTHLKQA